MDKTLLRPLFQKKYMEINKPQGFRSGAAIDFQQLAMANQSQPSNDQGIMTVTRPSGMQENVEVRERTPTQDVNITESIVSGRNNQNALEKDKRFEQELDQGIMSIQKENQQRPSQDPNTTFIDQRVNAQRLENDQERIQKLEEEKEKVKSEGLFSRDDQLGMFAALVARRLAQPGATLSRGFAYGVGDFASVYGKTKAAEAELLATKTKKGKNMWVFDSRADGGKGKNIYIPEGAYDPRYHTKAITEEKGFMDVVQFDEEGVPNVMSVATKNFNPKNQERFLGRTSVMLANDSNQTVIEITANELFRDNYFAEKVPGYKRKYVKPPSTRESAFADSLKRKEYEADMKERLKLEARLKKSFNLAQLGDKALGYINEGARAGQTATFSSLTAGLGAFIKNQFTRNEQGLNIPESVYNSEISQMQEKLKDQYGDQAVFETGVDGSQVNLTSLSKRFQTLDAGLQSLVIELAYAKAKQREEGGRFSVSDIENAMRSIGDVSEPTLLRQKLSETLYNDLNNPMEEWRRKYGELPSEYKELNMYRDLFERNRPIKVKPASQQEKEGTLPSGEPGIQILKPGQQPKPKGNDTNKGKGQTY